MPAILPKTTRRLVEIGTNIRLARLRRKISMTTLAERAGITRVTLHKVERGDPGYSIGVIATVLECLRLGDDLNLLARDDVLGRKLQDIELLGQDDGTKDSSYNLGKSTAATALHRARLLDAVPDSLTMGEVRQIQELYEKAAELTLRTGIKHHVDHIHALCGPNNGQHVLSNLQILTATENLKKGSKT